MKNVLAAILAVGILATSLPWAHYAAAKEPPSTNPVARLTSSDKAQREAALKEAMSAREEQIRAAVAIIESWERTRKDTRLSSSAAPPEYLALRLLAGYQAADALPIMLRNMEVIDQDVDPRNRRQIRLLTDSFPFAAAVSELGAPSVEPLLDMIGEAKSSVQLQLAVVCLHSILGADLSGAAIDLRIRDKGGAGSAGARPYEKAKKLNDTPTAMTDLTRDDFR